MKIEDATPPPDFTNRTFTVDGTETEIERLCAALDLVLDGGKLPTRYREVIREFHHSLSMACGW